MSRVAVAVLTIVALALRVRGMREGVYEDELYLVDEVQGRSYLGMLDVLANGLPGAPREVNPPLFYSLSWLSAQVGELTTAIRAPSVILGTATVPLVYLLGTRTVGRSAALVAAGFVALSPFAIFYGNEARAYATLMFFATLATLVLVVAATSSRTRWWVAYGASVTALLYTHYTGVLVVAVHALWVLWRHGEHWRPLLLAYAGAALAYAPWLPYVHTEPADFGALARIMGFDHWDAFLQWAAGVPRSAPADLPGTSSLVLLGSGLAVGVAGTVARRSSNAERADGLGLVLPLALVAPVFCLLYGLVGVDMFLYPRNMIASLPFAALALGWVLTPPARVARIVAVGLAGVALSIGAAKTLQDRFHRPDFPQAARLVDERAAQGHGVIHFGAGFAPFQLGRILPLYRERLRPAPGAGPDPAAVATAFQRFAVARRPVVLVELQDERGRVLPPVVAGWEERDERVLEGNPAIIVATYAQVRGEAPPVAAAPRRVKGMLDGALRVGASVQISGWAVGPANRPVRRVLAFAGDRLVAAGVPNRTREDVGKARGIDAKDVGWVLALPGDLAPVDTGRLRVYAIAAGGVSALGVVCTPQVRELVRC